MADVREIHDDEIDLFELFKTLWDGIWVIVGTVVITVVFGMVFYFFQPHSFNGTTTLYKAQDSNRSLRVTSRKNDISSTI